jgi:hypothetical protein
MLAGLFDTGQLTDMAAERKERSRKPNFRGQTTPELRLGEVEVPPSNFRITA